jgi:hypothetical protein
MKNRKIIFKSLLFSFFLFFTINSYSQTGLNFQGVARTSNNVILASQSISIRLTILRENTDGTKFEEYVETRKVSTNAQGLFTVVIGDTGTISKLGNFTTINWRLSPKFLKIEMDPTGGNNFLTMGTTQFQYVAYAQFAKSVDANNIVGIIPVTLGGTGLNSLTGLKSALALDKLNNTADTSKPISVLMQASLDSKLSKSDTSKYTKQTYTDSALLTKLSTTGNAATASTATKLVTARSINGVLFDGTADITVNADAGTLTGTTLKSTLTGSSLTSVGTLANLTVTNPIAGSITGNATTASTATKLATAKNINGVLFDGTADITVNADAGTLTGTTLKSTVTGSSLTSVGTLATLTVTNPIAGSITGNAATASTATKLATARNINGVLFDGTADITVNADAGTLTGTTLKSTVTGSSLTSVGTLANLTVTNLIVGSITGNAATATIAGNISGTTNTTLTSLSNLATVGTITSGVWSGTSINAGTLTGTILAENVVNSNLTSVGILTNTTINGKLVVGASNEQNSSAILEANSITKGFLPPRMSTEQRNIISNPVAGLMIWNITNNQIEIYNGSLWINTNGTTDQTLSVGDNYQGGKVAYILASGDPGYETNIQHGLIITKDDISSGAEWGCYGILITGGSESAIGTGNQNTIDIMAGCATSGIAARLCGNLINGGYSDWFLPSKDEFEKIWLNKDKLGIIGNSYWTSTQMLQFGAWCTAITGSGNGPKSQLVNIRAVRYF